MDGAGTSGALGRDTGIQVLDRAAALLALLADAGDEGLQLSRLAEGLGLSASTVHRLLAALEQHGWVERDDLARRHRLGLGLVALAGSAGDGTGLRRRCRPALSRISAATGEMTYLIARKGLDAVVVDRQEGSYVIESLTRGVGGVLPLGIGAGSLAILGVLPAAEAEAILGANADRYTRFGLTAAQIGARLGAIRAQGYLQDEAMMLRGMSVIAVPIRPPGRPVQAALSVNFITSRLDRAGREACLALLREEIRSIEAGMTPPERRTRTSRHGVT